MLMKYRLNKWTVRWIKIWLNYQAQRTVISNTKSSWRPVTGGVRQGLILVPMLFSIFINNANGGTECTFSVCRWYKIGRSGWHTRWLCCHSEGPGQPGELSQHELCEVQQGKSEVLHMRKNNLMPQDSLGAGRLGSSSAEKDLCILGDTRLNMSWQCALVANKTNRVLG